MPLDLFAFIFISLGLIAVPGPNVIVIVSTSLMHGKKRGLQTVCGTSLAMLFQLAFVIWATAYLVHLLAQGLMILKWLGVVYLVWLAYTHLRRCWRGTEMLSDEASSLNAIGSFRRGFWVSLLNPKTLIFFSAFLPQFVSPSHAYLPQMLTLSLIFFCLAVILDSFYALLAGHCQKWLQHSVFDRWQNGFIAGLYGVAALLLARNKT